MRRIDPRSPVTLLIAVASVVVFAGAVVVASSLSGDDEPVAHLSPDAEAEAPQPDVDVIDVEPVLVREYELFDGGTARLADERGTPVVVNFFASTCAPCIREMPALESVHQQRGDDLTIIGLAVSDRRSDAEKLVTETGVTYTIGDDPDAGFFAAFGGLALPTTALITADGEIADVHTGELTAGELNELIDEHLS